MKISAFTFLKNGSLLGYPFIQSIQSVLPIVDEFVVALGPSIDDTEAQLLALNEPKLHIIKSQWCDLMREKGYVYGQQKMVAQFNCTGDWAFYIEADEVVHENDLETIRAACETHLNNPNVEALVFDYLHFYGNKNTYLHSPGWYKRAPRIIKTNVRSYAPDGLFWLVLEKNKVGRYPKAALVGAHMYHYGWVRSEAQMNTKSNNVNQYWDKKPEQFDYAQIDSSILREFTQTHPKVMQDWLPESTGIFQASPNHRLTQKEKRHRLKAKLERIFHMDLSKKHFRLIAPHK